MGPVSTGPLLPVRHAVDLFLDHGTRHFSPGCDAPSGCVAPESSIVHGPSSLIARLTAYLDHWQVAHLVADCTGVGQGVVSYLRARLGEHRVTPYDFSQPRAKAQLGSAFLALIETNRFKYFQEDDGPQTIDHGHPPEGPSSSTVHGPSSIVQSPSSMVHRPWSDSWWFFQQAAACAYEIPPEGTIDRDLRWGVPASHRTQTPAGPQPTHDDRPLRSRDLSLGLARSAVIPRRTSAVQRLPTGPTHCAA